MAMTTMKTALVLGIAGGLLSVGSAARADTLITDFNNFDWVEANYGSWGNPFAATLTAGPDSYTVQSTGYGSNYAPFKDGVGDFMGIDATGETQLEFDVTVNAGPAGILLDLYDGDGTGFSWAWYGQPAGDYLFTADLATPLSTPAFGDDGVLDLSDLVSLHLGIDPGSPGTQQYNVSFNNLALVPEPASMALLMGTAGVALIRRRRH